MNPKFLHNMGLASLVAGIVFVLLALAWKTMK